MKYYILADTHFGHEKIKTWCNRPEGFEQLILKNLSQIPKGSVVIHLGDIAWYNVSHWNTIYIDELKRCKNWLIKGNHDKNSNTWYHNKGWDFVGGCVLLQQYGYKILFSHKPQESGDYYDVNIYGHLHNTGHHETVDDGKHICIYLEHHYCAQNLKTIIENWRRKHDTK